MAASISLAPDSGASIRQVARRAVRQVFATAGKNLAPTGTEI